ncbi:MAG: acyltransferase [Acidimicrobiales bacterium]
MFVAAPPRPGDIRTSFPYVPALDGIRGLLVFPVLLFHFSVTSAVDGKPPSLIAPGSYFAPSMFFTLSGFLITSLLLIEKQRASTVDWSAFWRRRFRRLVPASLTVILVAALMPVVWEGAWGKLLPSNVVAAIFSFKNWQDIGYASSRNQGLRTLGPLSPYWSLSIEEQFYLGMSIVIGLAMFARLWRRWLAIALSLIGLASIVAMVVVHSTPNRELFGTDIRASELVAGCLLAMAVQRWGWPSARWWGIVGFVSLAVTFVLWGWVSEHDAWVLDGGLAAVSLLNIGMILGAASWGSPFARLMAFRPLVEIGKLSYPLYLVHWPIALATQPAHTGLSGWTLTVVRFVISLAVAWPLAHWVEEPIRKQRVLKGRNFAFAWAGTAAFIVVVCVVINR